MRIGHLCLRVSCWPLSKGSWYRRLFCKAEVWSQQASVCLWSTDQINTSTAEIKPLQAETLAHTSTTVCILSSRRQYTDQALSQRTGENFPSFPHTRTCIQIGVHVLSCSLLFPCTVPHPLQGSWISSASNLLWITSCRTSGTTQHKWSSPFLFINDFLQDLFCAKENVPYLHN